MVQRNQQKTLKLSIVELVVIAAMLLALMTACFEAIEGHQVGKSDALKLAKLKGQEGLVALSYSTDRTGEK